MSLIDDIQHVVDQLPGSHQSNPLTGTTASDLFANTTTGNLSNNGLAAIHALDPTITSQRLVNGIDKGVGGNGNVFSDNSMNQEAGVFNTVGKLITSWYLGNQAGNLSDSTVVNGAAQGATTAGSSAGMNGQSVGDAAIAGGTTGAIAGYFAGPSTSQTTTDSTTITPSTEQTAQQTAQGATTSSQTVSASDRALRQAEISGLQSLATGHSADQALTAAGEGAITGATSTSDNHAVTGFINGAVQSGIAADQNGGNVEQAALYGGLISGARGGAGDATYSATDGNAVAARAAAEAAGGAATMLANQNASHPEQQAAQQVDPAFEQYMRNLQRGYSPAIVNTTAPIVVAGLQDPLAITPANNQSGGISPLLTQGAQ